MYKYTSILMQLSPWKHWGLFSGLYISIYNYFLWKKWENNNEEILYAETCYQIVNTNIKWYLTFLGHILHQWTKSSTVRRTQISICQHHRSWSKPSWARLTYRQPVLHPTTREPSEHAPPPEGLQFEHTTRRSRWRITQVFRPWKLSR